ncbi:hypothetical protein ABE67_01895 [Cytobacillus firmus]|jgi:hypothetical protein|nr:hypothetical protein [Cytobacillus firmus]MBG9448140.1 hypothetical protein [Cytobacillus firmus]
MVIYQSVQKGWPDQTPPYPRRFMGAEESGRSPGSWSMRSAPSHTCVYSGFADSYHLQWRDRAGISPASLLSLQKSLL